MVVTVMAVVCAVIVAVTAWSIAELCRRVAALEARAAPGQVDAAAAARAVGAGRGGASGGPDGQDVDHGRAAGRGRAGAQREGVVMSKLDEIKAMLAKRKDVPFAVRSDTEWLVGEVERLTRELAGAEASRLDVTLQRADAASLDAYQAFVQETAVWHARPAHIGEAAVPLVWALGACEEAGEVAKEVKRHVVYGRPLDRVGLSAEVGDALWYLTALANSLGLSFEAIAAANQAKVRAKFGHRAGVDQAAEVKP